MTKVIACPTSFCILTSVINASKRKKYFRLHEGIFSVVNTAYIARLLCACAVEKQGQRRYTDEDVPVAAEKLKMYTAGNEMLAKIGFVSIGMDHFALPGDKLLAAYKKGELHRNFMGYTTTNNRLLIGLDVSAIGDTWDAFAQNEKDVEAYEAKIHAGEWPLVNGHLLGNQDIIIRQHILNLMCRDTTTINESDLGPELYASFGNKAEKLVTDGLLTLQGDELHITPLCKLFIRNICATIDAYCYRQRRQAACLVRRFNDAKQDDSVLLKLVNNILIVGAIFRYQYFCLINKVIML